MSEGAREAAHGAAGELKTLLDELEREQRAAIAALAAEELGDWARHTARIYGLGRRLTAMAGEHASSQGSEHAGAAGDLRDQLAEMFRALFEEMDLAIIDTGESSEFADAAMAKIEPALDRLRVDRDQCIKISETNGRYAEQQRQRAERAEAELTRWRNLFGTAELEVTRARLARLAEAEAAIERVFAYCADWETRMAAQGFDQPPWVAMVRGLLSPAGGSEEKEDSNV